MLRVGMRERCGLHFGEGFFHPARKHLLCLGRADRVRKTQDRLVVRSDGAASPVPEHLLLFQLARPLKEMADKKGIRRFGEQGGKAVQPYALARLANGLRVGNVAQVSYRRAALPASYRELTEGSAASQS